MSKSHRSHRLTQGTPASGPAGRLRKFRCVYDSTCALLDELGLPFRNDPNCEVLYDDSEPVAQAAPAISYHLNGVIVICRRHVQEPLEQCQITLVHEITHYWCDSFPDVMRKRHVFRVPRPQPLPDDLAPQAGGEGELSSRYHWLAYDQENEDYVGTYSQVSSDECLAEFMAHLVVHDPDLRRVGSAPARRRYRACRRMLRDLRRVYSG